MSILFTYIGVIFLVMFIIGFLYAYIIYLKPLRRTWLEVVFGVGGKDVGEMVLLAVTFWYFGLLETLWPALLYPLAASAITGISQIYWQERKLREGRKKAKWAITKYNGMETEQEEGK